MYPVRTLGLDSFCCLLYQDSMRQLAFTIKTWGGKRTGAGRKPNGVDAGIPHGPRPELSRHHPVHVTLRVVRGCWNLRAYRFLDALKPAFAAGRDRFGFRLVHYTVQGNHLHLLVEAGDKTALSTGMKGLAVRCARAINGVMGRKGRVFADRYHEHVLKSRREVAHALRYVFGNFAHHAKRWGAQIAAAFVDPFSSVAWFAAEIPAGAPVAAPATWLLRVGWRDAPR